MLRPKNAARRSAGVASGRAYSGRPIGLGSPDQVVADQRPGTREPGLGRAVQWAGHQLPDLAAVLVVVAHLDDDTFGLGGIIARMAGSGTAVHILCFTHGEASMLNETEADLYATREAELRQASAELRAASVTLLGYPDGQLARCATELAAHVRNLIAAHNPNGLLVFDETGVTGHPDHQAANHMPVSAAMQAGLPVLARALPATIARQLREETGQHFAGQPPDRLDLCVRVDRPVQRRTALVHASQISSARSCGGGCNSSATVSTCAGSAAAHNRAASDEKQQGRTTRHGRVNGLLAQYRSACKPPLISDSRRPQ